MWAVYRETRYSQEFYGLSPGPKYRRTSVAADRDSGRVSMELTGTSVGSYARRGSYKIVGFANPQDQLGTNDGSRTIIILPIRLRNDISRTCRVILLRDASQRTRLLSDVLAITREGVSGAYINWGTLDNHP